MMVEAVSGLWWSRGELDATTGEGEAAVVVVAAGGVGLPKAARAPWAACCPRAARVMGRGRDVGPVEGPGDAWVAQRQRL
jgi:hypothetical protein